MQTPGKYTGPATIDSSDGCTLMVSAQKEEIFWELHLALNTAMHHSLWESSVDEPHLVGKQQDDGLKALLASIHVVAQEEVIALLRYPVRWPIKALHTGVSQLSQLLQLMSL